MMGNFIIYIFRATFTRMLYRNNIANENTME